MANSKLKCRNCKDRFAADSMINLNGGAFCVIDCAVEYASKKGKVLTKKRGAVERKKRKEGLRTRTDWYSILQKLVNQYVNKVRDEGKPCCTCGTTNNIKYDAGHYRTRGACPELRFQLTNIHRQCSVQCNQHGSGMRAEYREFIVAEYNQEHLEWLDGHHPSLKEQFPNIEDIKKEASIYRKLISDAGLKPCS